MIKGLSLNYYIKFNNNTENFYKIQMVQPATKTQAINQFIPNEKYFLFEKHEKIGSMIINIPRNKNLSCAYYD